MIPIQSLSAPKQLLGTIPELPSDREKGSVDTPKKDPLIAHGWDYVIYIGIFAIAITSIAIVGVVSPRVEHALYFALALSVVLIAFLFTV